MKLLILLLSLTIAGTSFVANASIKEEREQADSLMVAGEEKKAFKKYRDLARSGDNDSQYRLATLYADGIGTKPDPIDAYGWSVVAAEAGLDSLTEYSDSLLKTMDAKQQEKAEKKARSLVNKYGKDALTEKAARVSQRNNGARAGACTGSRLSCRNVISGSLPATQDGGQGMTDPTGG